MERRITPLCLSANMAFTHPEKTGEGEHVARCDPLHLA